MSVESNKEFVKQFLTMIGSGDAEGIANSYDAEGRVFTMGNTLISGVRGVADIKQFAGGVLDLFPAGLSYTIKTLTAEGDNVACECEAAGEHVTGVTYHQYYHFLFKFRNGKILELKEYMDTEMVTEVLCGGQRPE
ncbi:MAG: nuclear transport factor 2 family protein [Pseudomonadales bacterium]